MTENPNRGRILSPDFPAIKVNHSASRTHFEELKNDNLLAQRWGIKKFIAGQVQRILDARNQDDKVMFDYACIKLEDLLEEI